MQVLAEHVAGSASRPIPDEIVERAKLHLVDTIAAMISGTRLPAGQVAIPYVSSLGGAAEAGVLGTNIVTSAANAALANGIFAHADETDDTHPESHTHPGRNVVPAALAVGERGGLPGIAVLRAIVAGYDVCARVSLTLQPIAFQRSGHYKGAFGGIFGAGAAAAALLGLDERRTRHMFSYVAQCAAGLTTVFRDTEHVHKAFVGGGMPARHGTEAALMVAAGFTGVDDVFSGERDFFSTFAKDPDREILTRGLGADYKITGACIKCWSVGGPIQGPLQVLNELIQQHGLTPENVRELTVVLPDSDLEIVNDRDMPNISLQHLLSVMLVDGKLTFATTHDATRLADERVLAVKRRIKAVGDPALTDKQRRWRGIIKIETTDGRMLEHLTMAAKGSIENPVTRTEENAKALDLLEPVLGRQKTAALLDDLWSFDRLPDIRALRARYSPS
jgi:2-methylcitrate dehydratase PrpD